MESQVNNIYPGAPIAPLSLRAIKVYLEEAERKLAENKDLSYLREFDYASSRVSKGFETVNYLEEDLITCRRLLKDFESSKERSEGIKNWVLSSYEEYFGIKGHRLHFETISINESTKQVMYILGYFDENRDDINIYLDLDSVSPIVNFLELYETLYRRRSSLGIHNDLELELSEKMLKEQEE
jgi:hypothetical protein